MKLLTPAEQYVICKERGHTPDPYYPKTYYSLPVNVPQLDWNHCKYCYTDYATEVTTELIEKNAPLKVEE